MNRLSRRGLALAGSFLLAACTTAPPEPAPAPVSETTEPTSGVAIFAGGCFWCMESDFEKVEGVTEVISGYTGGHITDPTYEQVSAGGTGHAEAVQVLFEPDRVSYADLLDVFWRNIDPTQASGQFCDEGDSYRSAIFFLDAEQQRLAETSRTAIVESGRLKAPIVTEIEPAAEFFPAEDYHQDFARKNPFRYVVYRFGCGRDERLEQLWGSSESGG